MCIALQLRSVQHEADRAEQLVRVGLSALTLCISQLIRVCDSDLIFLKS